MRIGDVKGMRNLRGINVDLKRAAATSALTLRQGRVNVTFALDNIAKI